MPPRVRAGGSRVTVGGIVGYPLDELYEEVAFVAYHLHWPQEELMQMEHRDRREWVSQVSAINRRMNGE